MRQIRSRRLLSILVALGVMVPPAPVAADDWDPCGDVQLVFARGTTEPVDSGAFLELNQNLDDRLGETVAYSSYELGKLGGTDGFSYPATGQPIGFFFEWNGVHWGEYHDSKEAGRQELDAYLTRRAQECPNELFVLAGWSQGAHVMGEGMFLLDPAVRDRIAFVALFGDPTLDTGFDTLVPAELAGPFLDACNGRPEPWIRGSAPCWNPGGVFGRRDPYVPADMVGDVGSWCRGGDPACTSLPQNFVSGDEHRKYFDPDSEAAEAMREAAERVAARLPGQADDIDISFLQFATGVAGADLVFVFDTTGSMGGEIADAKAQATELASLWLDLAVDGRVALVQFRDHVDPFASRLELPLTNDESAFQTAVNGLVAGGGGDTPEAQLSGLMTALNGLDWRDGATKVAIVITDAPGKDPEPVTGFTRAQVSQRALEIDPVAIFGVDVIDFPEVSGFMQPMADATAGDVFALDPGESLSDVLFEVIDIVAFNPVAMLNGPYIVETGTPVHFRASGSFDPDGSIVSYGWDFDGDGVVDQTTAEPTVDHLYNGSYDGLATVRVTAADGGEALASAVVQVDDVGLADDYPVRPTAATATVTGAGQVTVTWTPAANDRAAAYRISQGGDPVMRSALAGEPTSVVFDGVDLSQPQQFVVVAANDFGYSAAAVATVGGGDTTPPSSQAGALPATTTAGSITVPFTASDAGSGVASVELWARYRTSLAATWGSWTLAGTRTLSPFSYTLAGGDGRYEFHTVAVDGAGNREAPPALADASTHRDAVDDPPDLSFGWDLDATIDCNPRTGCVVHRWIEAGGIATDDRSNVTAVDYRVYGIESNGTKRRLNNWRAAYAQDGSFNSPFERYRFSAGYDERYVDYEFEIRVTAGGVQVIRLY